MNIGTSTKQDDYYCSGHLVDDIEKVWLGHRLVSKRRISLSVAIANKL